MACYHPLKAFEIYYDKKTKKPKYKICSSNVKYIEILKNGTIIKRFDDSCATTNHNTNSIVRTVKNYMEIPCGSCLGCRLDYSRQWADRCMLELSEHTSSYFVTLTYDDYHLPKTHYVNPETGELCVANTLVKSDFQKFIRSLRKRTGQKIRYFMSGEYGTNTIRPHYHAILFGLSLDDLRQVGANKLGQPYYTSDTILSAWSDSDGLPRGFCTIGDVTWESCAYTARYVMKKVGQDKEVFTSRNMQPEFTLMSRKPGIGYGYYASHPKLMEYEHIHYSTPEGGKQCSIPRYFKRKYAEENPSSVGPSKYKRKYLKVYRSLKQEQTTLDYEAQLLAEEEAKRRAIKVLERSKV